MTDDNASAKDAIDLLVIGGGINGCGIARDAVGRGLSVALCEQADLAQATSSASTKLFHGGLRYLEHYEFRLVREALMERETLLRAMPHISWPLRFVLPHHKGLRPRWLLRLGLFIYDHLGGRKLLPGTRTLNLETDPIGDALKEEFKVGFEYSDCWVEDARLVVLNARDAADRGAQILVRTRCEKVERDGDDWIADLKDLASGESRRIRARAVVNAAGPWVEDVIRNRFRRNAAAGVRLVRGSHIVTRRLYAHDRAYIFQNADGRIIFAIPYEGDFTLIGTTDVDHKDGLDAIACAPHESDYLREAASEYFRQPINTEDVVWTYAGVRPLYDDGADSASQATRDYVLKVDGIDKDVCTEAPVLNIFGGKITTYRRLAEAALDRLRPRFPDMGADWTAGVALPGGDFPVDGAGALTATLRERHAFLTENWATRLVKAYGVDALKMLDGAAAIDDMGRDFGATLTEREVRWLMDREWAVAADDIIWRRSKLGLRLSTDQVAVLEGFLKTAARQSAA